MSRNHRDSASLIAEDLAGEPVSIASVRTTTSPTMMQDAKKKTKAARAPGSEHGKSIKNPATYEALKRQGKSKSSAAAISNAALNKGYRRGAHGRGR